MGKLRFNGLQDDISVIRRELLQILDDIHGKTDSIHIYTIAYAIGLVNLERISGVQVAR